MLQPRIMLTGGTEDDFPFKDIIDFMISFYKQREARRAAEAEKTGDEELSVCCEEFYNSCHGKGGKFCPTHGGKGGSGGSGKGVSGKAASRKRVSGKLIDPNDGKAPLLDRAKKLGLPGKEYAVAGSAWWDVKGIRRADDLDIVITPKLWKTLEKRKDWDVIQYNGFKALQKKDDKFIGVVDAVTLPATSTNGVKPDLMRWINDAVVVEGIPLVKLDELVRLKTAYDRPKDRRDIRSMNKHLKTQSLATLEPTITIWPSVPLNRDH